MSDITIMALVHNEINCDSVEIFTSRLRTCVLCHKLQIHYVLNMRSLIIAICEETKRTHVHVEMSAMTPVSLNDHHKTHFTEESEKLYPTKITELIA